MGEENNFYLAPWVREYKEEEKAKQTWLLQLAEKYALSVEDSKHPNGHYMNEVIITPYGTSLGTVSSDAMLDNLVSTLRESAAKERKLGREMILHIHKGLLEAAKWLAPLVAAPVAPLMWTFFNSPLVLTPLTALSLYDAGKDVATGNVTWKTGLKALPALDIPRQIGLWDNLAALLGNNAAKVRTLGRELNKTVKNTKLQESSIFPGLIGWAPRQNVNGFHVSNDAQFSPNFWFENWATKTHDAPKGIYLSTTKPTSGFLTERPYIYQMLTTLEKPMVLIGEVYGPTKNGIRNYIERLALSMNADGIIYLGIRDNLMPNLTIIKTLNPDVKLNITSRGPARISLAERMGIPKGERNNLNIFLKLALEDLLLYINSGLYRQFPTINMETAEPSWVAQNSGHPSALQLLIDDGVPSSGRSSWAWNRPNGGTYELVTDGSGNFGIGYNSYRMFDISPEFNVRVGEASAGSAKNGYSKIFLTAPRNDAIHFITESPEQESAKKMLLETQSPRIKKDIMRDFWSGVALSLKPGSYLSGDEGNLPKGYLLIKYFKELSKKGYIKDNNGNIVKSGRTNWEDIRNWLLRKESWRSHSSGLSTDSYLALLKLANRENSPYYLRYSPDGFTEFNSLSIDNKFISDLLEKTKTGEATQQEFLEAFHNWVSPYGGMDAKIVNGKIIIPHPFLYKKKQGGKMNILQFLKNGSGIHIKKKNRGKFTDYCGGKVTSECIAKGKRSSNPAIRKRATFAANARKWKHKFGGLINYAANGDNTLNWWLRNSGTINTIGNTISEALPSIVNSILKKRAADLDARANEISDNISELELFNKYYAKEMSNFNSSPILVNGLIINLSPVVASSYAYLNAWNKAKSEMLSNRLKTKLKNAKLYQEANTDLNNAILGSVGKLALAGYKLYANNKASTNTTLTTPTNGMIDAVTPLNTHNYGYDYA